MNGPSALSVSEFNLSALQGLAVHLPDGRRLGIVHDAVIDVAEWDSTHLFVVDCDPDLVENRIHVAVPWRWVRAVSEIIILRWFPPTPIPA